MFTYLIKDEGRVCYTHHFGVSIREVSRMHTCNELWNLRSCNCLPIVGFKPHSIQWKRSKLAISGPVLMDIHNHGKIIILEKMQHIAKGFRPVTSPMAKAKPISPARPTKGMLPDKFNYRDIIHGIFSKHKLMRRWHSSHSWWSYSTMDSMMMYIYIAFSILGILIFFSMPPFMSFNV